MARGAQPAASLVVVGGVGGVESAVEFSQPEPQLEPSSSWLAHLSRAATTSAKSATSVSRLDDQLGGHAHAGPPKWL